MPDEEQSEGQAQGRPGQDESPREGAPTAQRDDAAATEPPPEGPQREPAAEHRAEAAKASLAVLVNSVATQVFVSLGEVENPLSGKKEVDLMSAKFSIDLLQMLEDKTKGNLTDFEKRYLRGVLDELRLRYVKAAREPSGGAAGEPKA